MAEHPQPMDELIDDARQRAKGYKPTATVWRCTPDCWRTGNHEDGCAPLPDAGDLLSRDVLALCDEIERLQGIVLCLVGRWPDCNAGDCGQPCRPQQIQPTTNNQKGNNQ